MPTIHVIASTGSQAGDQILRGVYGELNPQTAQFKIAPEFERISYLFGLLDNGTSPVSVGETVAVECANDNAAMLTKAQLMHSLATGWSHAYGAVAANGPADMPGNPGSDGGMLKTMLRNESSKLTAAVDNHLAQQGLSVWHVPVQLVTELPYLGWQEDVTERTLIDSLNQKTDEHNSMTLVPGGTPVQMGTEFMRNPYQTAPHGPREVEPEPAGEVAYQRPAWADYGAGLVTATASLVVVAANADQATQAAQIKQMLRGQLGNMLKSQVIVESIDQVEDTTETAGDDYQERGYERE